MKKHLILFSEKKNMQLPDDVLNLIKVMSKPLPNNGYTTGLSDSEIALLYIDVWALNNFKDDAKFMFIISSSKKGWFIQIYDENTVYYNYTWTTKELRQWDGYVGFYSNRSYLKID